MKCPHRYVAVAFFLVLASTVAMLRGETRPSVRAPTNDATTWVRRSGQLAKVANDRLADFKELTSRPPAGLSALLKQHRFRSQSVFVKDLAPDAYYAFRFVEYEGDDFDRDLRDLEELPPYGDWREGVDRCLESPWTDLEEVFFWAGRSDRDVASDNLQRLGRVVGLRPEMADAYKLLHAHPWPGVLAAITEGNIRNYPIYWATIDSKMYLFAYFEYVGDDFQADMAAIGADPATKAWIKFTDQGCQLPIDTRRPGEWWAAMERVSFVMDDVGTGGP